MSFQFRGQWPNEEIVLLVKQHPFALLKHGFEVVGLLLIPLFAYIFIVFGSLFLYIFLVCLLLAIIKTFLTFYKWMNTVVLLSNQRVILVRQRGVLNREFTECSLESIQQVNHRVAGLLGTLFDYGNIEISIGGTQQPFILHNIPETYDIQQEILKATSK